MEPADTVACFLPFHRHNLQGPNFDHNSFVEEEELVVDMTKVQAEMYTDSKEEGNKAEVSVEEWYDQKMRCRDSHSEYLVDQSGYSIQVVVVEVQ